MSTQTEIHTLSNGLRVILRPVHTAPVVTTWLWLRVGSRNEVEGTTGLSHWVEHMMFKGSPGYPQGTIMRLVNRHGGYANAMTSNDFTTYYATLPATRASLPLEIEADRLQGARFDPEEVDLERQVIIAEREGSENEPLYRLAEQVGAAAFQLHPYHHQTIGWKEDLLAIDREQLVAHYRRYYQPNNATLVVVGDIDPSAHLRTVQETLGTLPSGPEPEDNVRAEPPQLGERRLTLSMPGSAPTMRLCYHTPPVSHPDYMPMVILDALLSGAKAMFSFGQSQARSARLYRALVETQLASAVGSNYHPSLDPYLLTIGATARDGVNPERVEAAVLEQVDLLRQERTNEDALRVAIRQAQAQFAYSAESVSDQALTLGFLDMVDDPARIDRVLDELRAVTPDAVQRVAQTYLRPENRVLGWFIPSDGRNPLSTPTAVAPQPAERDVRPTDRRASAAVHSVGGHSPQATRHTCANGLRLLIQPNPASSTLAVEGYADAGAIHDDPQTVGRASLMAAMLRRGSQIHTFSELNQLLDGAGASVGTNAGRNALSFWGQSLAADADLLYGTLHECLTQPAFAAEEVDKYRGQLLTHLGILATDTGYRADRAFMGALYGPDHPYGRSTIGTPETLPTLDPSALRAYHERQLDPSTMVVAVVGDVQPQAVIEAIERSLGSWRPQTDLKARQPLSGQNPHQVLRCPVEIPERPQIDLLLGVIGLSRRSPDYYPAMMANIILGRLGMMGRLGANVRDAQGLAYYCSSSLRAGYGVLPWSIVAGVAPDHVERAVEAMLAEVRHLCDEPVSPEELADCKSYLVGAQPLRLETNEGIANHLLLIEEHALGEDYGQRYPDLINAVSAEDIQRVVNSYWADQAYVLAMAGTLQG